MAKYVIEGERIEGSTIFCTFEKRPSFRSDNNSGEQISTITGNPATATIDEVYVYITNKKKQKKHR